jgi:hypothetical protein
MTCRTLLQPKPMDRYVAKHSSVDSYSPAVSFVYQFEQTFNDIVPQLDDGVDPCNINQIKQTNKLLTCVLWYM